MDFVGGDHTVEIRIDLTPQDRVGEPLVVEVAEHLRRSLIAETGRISPTPGIHIERETDLGV